METLDIDQTSEGSTLTLTLKGRLSIATSPQLAAVIDSMSDTVKTLQIVAANVEYISSAGLRVLVAAHKKMAAAGGSMEILKPTAEILELFDMTGLKDIFKVR